MAWPFGGCRDAWPNSMPFFYYSKRDFDSLEAAYQNYLVVGATGVSKTTAPLAALRKSLLDKTLRMGGWIGTCKVDDVERVEKDCRRAGRHRDLVIFDESETFDFLAYEAERPGGGDVENIVDLLLVACEFSERGKTLHGHGGENNKFWRDTLREFFRNAVVLLKHAGKRIGVREIYDLVHSAPTSLEMRSSPEWRSSSFCAECLQQADERTPEDDRDDLDIAAIFFAHFWPTHDERTRANIRSTIMSVLDTLLRGLPKRMLCSGTSSVTPEMTFDGKIVVMGIPTIKGGASSLLTQGIVRYSFQRAFRRRNTKQCRGLFLSKLMSFSRR